MKGLIALLLGFMLGSCGSSSGGGNSQALCMEASQALCDKVYDCAEGEPLRQFFGATKAECLTSLNADCASMPCETGETYHGDQAQACVNAFKAITCAQLSDPAAVAPASCEMVCTGGTT